MSNTDAGLSVGPRRRCQELIFKHANLQIIVFRPQEHDSCIFALTQFVLDELPTALANIISCYTSPAERLGPGCSILFLARGRDSQFAILDLDFSVCAPRVWCDGFHGAAHNRFSSDQKQFVNQLNFSNFVFRGAARNVTYIFGAGFTFILYKALFVMPWGVQILHWNLHVLILTCFAQLFSLFCFGMCFAMLTPERFSIVIKPLKCCFKTVLSRKCSCA